MIPGCSGIFRFSRRPHIQDANGKQLDMFPLEPGQVRTTRVFIEEGGFRYRCPINPTPWYEVSAGS